MFDLIETFKEKLNVPKRDFSGPFMFSFDHAFPIKGQGTVLTGTVLSGTVKPQQAIVVPSLGEAGKGKKVRSLQMFKRPVQEARKGDRVAMCVAALDSKELERGIVIAEKFPVPTLDACVCVINRLSYFKAEVKTKAKFHVTLGHSTVMASAYFFCPLDVGAQPSTSSAAERKAPGEAAVVTSKKGAPAAATATPQQGGPSLAMGCGALVADRQKNWPTTFDFDASYLHLDELFQHGAPVEYENNDGDVVRLGPGTEPGELDFQLNGAAKGVATELRFDAASGRLVRQNDEPLGSSVDSRSVVPLKDRDRVLYLLRYLAQMNSVPGLPELQEGTEPMAYALLIFEKPVTCPIGSLLVASKLDFDIHTPNCRLAFFGRILTQMDPKDRKPLRLVKMKQKVGFLERFDKQERNLMICKDMFKADTDMSLFNGLKVVHEASGAEGVIEGLYGTAGKFKVRFQEELKVKTDAKGNIKGEDQITLYFKKYDFEQSSKIMQ
jgi:hypothetical protein